MRGCLILNVVVEKVVKVDIVKIILGIFLESKVLERGLREL